MKITMKLEKKEKVVVAKAAAFYLLLGILLVAILYMFVDRWTKLLIRAEENNVQKLLESEVREARSAMDTELKRANAVCFSILQNENFRYILNSGDERRCLNAILKISREINLNVLSDDFIEDALVYMNIGDGIFINSEGKVDEETIIAGFFGDEEEVSFSDEVILNETVEFTSGKLLYLKNGQLCYMQTYPVSSQGEGFKGIFFVKLQNQVLNSSLSEYDPASDTDTLISVLDLKTDEIAINSEWSTWPGISADALKGNQGLERIGGYLVAYRTSERVPVKYVGVKSLGELEGIIGKIRVSSKLLFGVSVVLCFVLMGMGIWRSYNPIRQLLDLMNGEENRKFHIINFYPEIRSMLLEALEQKMAYENLYEEKNSLEKGRMFSTVLGDKRSSDEAVMKSAHAIGLYPEKGFTCFILLKFIDITACFSKQQEERSEVLPVRFCEAFIIKILEQHYKVFSIPMEERILFCLWREENRQDGSGQMLTGSFEQVQVLLRERYAIDTQIAISSYHTGIGGLKIGFQEAKRTMEHLEFTGNKELAEYYSLSLSQEENQFWSAGLKEETYLENYIKAGEIGKAKEVFGRIMETYGDNLSFLPSIYRLRLYALLSKILDSVNYAYVVKENRSVDEISEYVSLIEFDDVKEFRRKIDELFDKIADSSQSAQNDLEIDFVNAVQKIIADNYMNYDLNVTAIADSLHKNLDFVSRTFKKNMGEGLLDYIQKVRIDKAKQFFRENEELSVRQVSNMVGYVSCESFIRVFKNKEGMTPGRYKSSVKRISRSAENAD